MRAPPTAARGNIPYPRPFGEPPRMRLGGLFGGGFAYLHTGGAHSCSEYRPHGERRLALRTDTDPAGKWRRMLRPAANVAGGPQPVIPTLWGKNTDPTGKRCEPEAGVLAPRPPLQAAESPLDAGYWQCAGPGRPSPALTDPRGEEYRSCWERIPTLWGDFYRPFGENLPIPAGYFTDPRGVDYRPHGEIRRLKYLQIHGFCSLGSVYMMFCLCLVFCLVNREGLGG